uniref:CSON012868 protein n=1 Tax=Culicoides sonorensis TaxID=179676 RepID=A0A336LN98_CULSO
MSTSNIISISNKEKDDNIQRLSQEMQQMKEKSRNLQDENENLSERNSIIQHQLNEVTEKLSKALHDQRNALNENVQLEKSLNEKKSSILEFQNVITEKEKELERFKMKLNELEKMKGNSSKERISVEQDFRSKPNEINHSIDKVRNVSEIGFTILGKEKNTSDQKLKEAIDSFLKRTDSTDSSQLTSSREKVVKVHEYGTKSKNDSKPKSKQEIENAKLDKPNVTRTESISEKDRLEKENEFHSTTSMGPEFQALPIPSMESHCNHDHMDCKTICHPIPPICDAICVCLPHDYDLCCSDVIQVHYDGCPNRCFGGESKREDFKNNSVMHNSGGKSSSDSSFYIDLLCESLGTSDEFSSCYIEFEKKLFDDLKYRKFKKFSNKKYNKKDFQAPHDLNKAMMIHESKSDFLFENIQKLPLPPQLPSTL